MNMYKYKYKYYVPCIIYVDGLKSPLKWMNMVSHWGRFTIVLLSMIVNSIEIEQVMRMPGIPNDD